MTFKLDFAPHLGFPGPASPLFDALVGSIDPVDHIRFAADHGFRRVQDPFAAAREESEQARIGKAAAEHGLALGCVVYAPMDVARRPLWIQSDTAPLDQQVDRAFAIAERLGTRYIAVLTGKDPALPFEDQLRRFTDNLQRIGTHAAAAGFVLCIEAVHGRRLPDMLLNHILDADRVVRDTGLASVRLIFDFGHVQAMDGDLLHHLDAVWDQVELIQVADSPDRVEPGAGEINIGRLLDRLVERGFTGPCELEHSWTTRTAERQRAYLDWLENWAAA